MTVWNEAEDHGPWQTSKTTDYTDCPQSAVESCHTKCLASDEDDHDLSADDEGIDTQEPIVAEHAFEDVKAVIEAAVVELVEYLHPYERVEYNRGKLLRAEFRVIGDEICVENLITSKV